MFSEAFQGMHISMHAALVLFGTHREMAYWEHGRASGGIFEFYLYFVLAVPLALFEGQ